MYTVVVNIHFDLKIVTVWTQTYTKLHTISQSRLIKFGLKLRHFTSKTNPTKKRLPFESNVHFFIHNKEQILDAYWFRRLSRIFMFFS